MDNKSTQRAQTSLPKATWYPHIARISDSKSQNGDPDASTKFKQLCLISLQSYPENSSTSTHDLLTNGRISNWKSAW